MIFVFGSNLAGVHGAGAAAFALRNHGAEWSIGEGPTGNSYALPTKDHNIRSRPLADIHKSVLRFIQHAKDNPDTEFQVTAVGCGLAGFTPAQIAPMFEDVPGNCFLPPEFLKALEAKSND